MARLGFFYLWQGAEDFTGVYHQGVADGEGCGKVFICADEFGWDLSGFQDAEGREDEDDSERRETQAAYGCDKVFSVGVHLGGLNGGEVVVELVLLGWGL